MGINLRSDKSDISIIFSSELFDRNLSNKIRAGVIPKEVYWDLY